MIAATPTATTSSGVLRGTVSGGVRRFLGVPYAAAPFGRNRFAPPQPFSPVTEEIDAINFGPTAPQVPYTGGLERVLPSVRVAGTEILNLNIWAPEAAPPMRGRPVLVWFHGGALTRGSTAIATYDGQAFARDGVVFVSVNYRLGAEGFSVLDDAPANLGLADQVAALRWVRVNIAAFGGDPSRVTVFGQSAGANSVAALLANARTTALFARAILQSGPLNAAPRAQAREITELMAKDLGIPLTRNAFAAVPAEELVASQHRVRVGNPLTGGGAGFAISVDDDLVPADPAPALRGGAATQIPIMIGYTSEEYRLWFTPTGLLDRVRRRHLLAARLKMRIPGRAVRLYRRSRPGAPSGEILGMLASDVLLRLPANDLADARATHGGRSWLYEFGWRSPVLDLGAAHALELGFVFDTLDGAEAAAFAGPQPPQQLADAMHAAWVRFAETGDPGWPQWDQRRPVMTFDAPASRLVFAPREDERRALSRR